MPHLGISAIYKAAVTVSKPEDYRFNLDGHEALGSATLNVSTIRGGRNVNSVPDRVEIGIDIQTLPNHDHVVIMNDIGRYR
jgi:succinyl-diaminopimelate desuccinylase